MKFLTFVEIDLRKIIPFLIGLFVVAIAAFQGLFYSAVTGVHEDLVKDVALSGMTMDEYVKTISPISLTGMFDNYSPFAILVMIFIGLVLILFGFYLWYKEWFGASKRIYTLLSIKGSRFRIFLTKLVVFLFIFFAYYGIVLLNLFISGFVMKMVLPAGAVADKLVQSALLQSQMVHYIIPNSISEFVYKLVFIIMIFAILSVFVLLDRSKKIWGLVSGLVYVVGSMILFVYITTLELFTSERMWVNWAFTASFLIVSTVLSYYLLKKKVSI